MDEETQFQLALRLSREEQERRLQVQQKQDFETALKLQREELERAPPSVLPFPFLLSPKRSF